MPTPKNRGLPPGIANNIHSAPVERQKKTYGPAPVEEETESAQTQLSKKIGRPKGRVKVKKTIYITRSDDFAKAQKGLVKNADILISNDNELVDLALALLASMTSDLNKVKEVISIYEAEIKSALKR
ncbi:MAG: hypothetical protein H0X33_13380 [Taibaiella sp.]|nr:hypothetical protein [Taibaiella sp.]